MVAENLLDKIIDLAKRRGFVFPGSEIYGGLRNSWDYGPLGVELKNNIKRAWWQRFVHGRLDVVGIDAALIMNTKVWKASGHLKNFTDPLVECKNCHTRFRSILQFSPRAKFEGFKAEQQCPNPNCGKSDVTETKQFNLLFKTFIGSAEESAHEVYLRPETAQAMFVDFPAVQQTSRQRVPFGIAQVGKAFRNEITPGNFIFRTREFEQMEIEYFIQPGQWEEHFDEWLSAMHDWIAFCGIDTKRIHNLEVAKENLAHYSKRTVDIEFDWPFGRDELYGIAYRGDYDLSQHAAASGVDMNYTDPESGEKYIPHVIEPTFGVDRTFLAMMLSAYNEEEVKGEKRVILKFPAQFAPYQVAVLPLSKKPELEKIARPIVADLAHKFRVDYDATQSIGRRYRRQDEIGTPSCITIDFDTINDQAVTIRDRDTMEQERVAISRAAEILSQRLATGPS